MNAKPGRRSIREALDADAKKGDGFRSVAERVRGERTQRLMLAARSMPYHLPFFDDCLKGMLPNDLVLLGADSGLGKSEAAQQIAFTNARKGKRVHLFALEAAQLEVERRQKYRLICEMAFAAGIDTSLLSFRDWWYGELDYLIYDLDCEAEYETQKLFSTMRTCYKTQAFNAEKLVEEIKKIDDQTDLVVVDHLHYLDIDDDNENRGYRKAMQLLSFVPERLGIPVLLVVHLRKRDQRVRSLVPDLGDIHGSSDISKICTQSLMLAHAKGLPFDKRYQPTYMTVNKDRAGGANRLIALCRFDKYTRSYTNDYTLGVAKFPGDEFDPIGMADAPRWARRHVPMVDDQGGRGADEPPPPIDADMPPQEDLFQEPS